MSFSNGRKISASPTSSSVQYTYSFSSWTNASGTVTGATTITANFSQSVNNYTVRFSSGNSAYGTVSTGSISVPYGTTYSVSGNTVRLPMVQVLRLIQTVLQRSIHIHSLVGHPITVLSQEQLI